MKIILVSDQISPTERVIGIIARACGRKPISTFQAPGIDSSVIARTLQKSRLDAVICRSSTIFPGGLLVSIDQLSSLLAKEADHQGIMILILRHADLEATHLAATRELNLKYKEVKDSSYLFLLDLERLTAQTMD